jgi:predicted RNA-binding Zn-ribbon protein involved in translation (DUF1610 family)
MSKIHEGYLMIDHRASPGTELVPEGILFETATMHCAHCGTVVIINPNRTRDRAWCVSCDKYICDNCGIETKLPDYVHKSYKQHLDQIYNGVNS